MNSLENTENFCAQNSKAPRVSLKSLECKIVGKTFFTAGQAIRALGLPVHPASADLLTLCILTMQNGFSVVGKAAPASPENFDPEKGRQCAYEDAVRQLWPLEGYLLRDKLHRISEINSELEDAIARDRKSIEQLDENVRITGGQHDGAPRFSDPDASYIARVYDNEFQGWRDAHGRLWSRQVGGELVQTYR